MTGLVLLGMCIVFSAGASYFLKLATSSTDGTGGILALAENPMIWIGAISYVGSFLGYVYVLRLVPLSLAQPVITAGVSVATALLAVLFLREQMMPVNWVGLFLICLGIICLSFGRA